MKLHPLVGLALVAWVAVPSVRAEEADVLVALQTLPGVEAKETTVEADTAKGLRRFAITLEQPTDHFDASAGSFRQKLVLFHRGYEEPMVLQTSGYSIFGERLSRIAARFETNQIQVEHRFFSGSSPEPRDWTKLTVRQSAEDFHRVVTTFKALYPSRWVNTGASKGGMTSIYHRRFFPNDLDGTLADVAPLSFTTDDPRYVEFVDAVGGEAYAGCREKLETLQATLLGRREELLPLIEGEFGSLGGKSVALEHATLELPFIFWQYGDPDHATLGCGAIPGPATDIPALAKFLDDTNAPSSYGDDSIRAFQPYYYQAAAELGAPGTKLSHLADLLQHPYLLDPYLPGGQAVPYTDATMRDVASWVAQEASTMMFVYGEFDPWTAGAFRSVSSAEGSDNHWYEVPRGNHGAEYSDLPDALKGEALATLAAWLDKAPVAERATDSELHLGDLELEATRRLRFH
ncbi:MAG: hypothetical protein IT285_00235 [Bdellovibrionales bacterium]|nr:hypothetical protein [Bdellovibrionales bacterium]